MIQFQVHITGAEGKVFFSKFREMKYKKVLQTHFY